MNHVLSCLPLTARPSSLLSSRVPISIRTATTGDLPFLNALQKANSKALGYFPTKQFEGYIAIGAVLVAEGQGAQPLGYVIARDRYLKRDELGVIYQLCVAPGAQRKLIGASLIKAAFERSAYGCRLYCCWCAQDLDANYFWESLGFVPIAFRGGSGKRQRVHIFWQRRIVEGDTATPWWFPAKTDAGAMREDRLVFPIPPGLHWRDSMPVLWGSAVERAQSIHATGSKRKEPNGPKVGSNGGPQTPRPRARPQFGPPAPPAASAKPAVGGDQQEAQAIAAPAKVSRAKTKCDPKLVAAARELRDRYLERVNADARALARAGKYEVSRGLTESTAPMLLPAPPLRRLSSAA